MEPPKVSVLTIVRNGAATLPLALASLLRQNIEDWECIVINDASTDSTKDFLESLEDPRFRSYHFNKPLGRGAARNKALEKATGKYITTLDADDFYFEKTLEQHLRVLEPNPSLSLSSGRVILFDLKRNLFRKLRKTNRSGLIRFGPKPSTLEFPLAATMLRRSDIGSQRYDPNYNRSEDREFFGRVLSNRSIFYLNTATYAYRWQPNPEDVLLGLKMREQTYRKYWKESPTSYFLALTLNSFKILIYNFTIKFKLELLMEKLKTSKLDKRSRRMVQSELKLSRHLAELLTETLHEGTKFLPKINHTKQKEL